MKKIKRILAVVLMLAIAVIATACGTEKPSEVSSTPSEVVLEKTKVTVNCLKGPTGIGMVKLMADNDKGDALNDYTINIASAPEDIAASVIKGEVDIAAVPVNLAATLYNKTQGKYVVCGINTLGVLYMLDTTNTIANIEDLRGKKIYATGQGSTPEYILRYVLSKNNIDPDKDVTIEFIAEHAELVSLMAAGKAEIALLPEPNATTTLMQNQNAKRVLNMTEEWNKISTDGSQVVQGCIIAKKEFLDNNAEAYANFIKEYDASVKYVNEQTEEASAVVEQYGIVPKAAVAKNAIPNCNITLIKGEEMKNTLSPFLKVLFDYNVQSVGGKLPDDSFYYIGK